MRVSEAFAILSPSPWPSPTRGEGNEFKAKRLMRSYYSERLKEIVIARSGATRQSHEIHFVRNDASFYDNLFKPFTIDYRKQAFIKYSINPLGDDPACFNSKRGGLHEDE